MNSKWHRGSWLVTLSVSAVSLGYLGFVFLPGNRGIADLRHELRNKQDFIAAAGQLAVQVHHAKAELIETQAYTAGWRGRGDTSAEMATVFGEIAQITQDAGVTTTRFAPGTAVEYECLTRLPLSLSCDGTFAHVRALLAGLERLPQRIWIRECKLEGDVRVSDLVHCQIDLAIFADKTEDSGQANPAR